MTATSSQARRRSARPASASHSNPGLAAAASRLLRLDDLGWRALEAMRADYADAASHGDERALEIIEGYARELLGPSGEGDPFIPAEDALARIEAVPGVRAAIRRVEKAEGAFFDRYFAAKARSPHKTQRAVARAAGVSPVTIQAIESRRIKPHFKTIEKIARAFGVPVTDLLGEQQP